MAEPRPAGRAKLFVGVLAARAELLPLCRARLEEAFGPVDEASEVMQFNFTRYYEPEMGPAIQRQFFAFAELIRPDFLSEVKLRTNRVEREIAEVVRAVPRPVNLDPGYLTLSKVVLATMKDHAHRLYLCAGVYAEVTLYFCRGKWEPWPWTYADYASEAYRTFFSRVRERFRLQLRSERGGLPFLERGGEMS